MCTHPYLLSGQLGGRPSGEGVKGPHPCSRLAVPMRWSMVLTGWSAAAELPGCRQWG
jgi:hypothetical protein